MNRRYYLIVRPRDKPSFWAFSSNSRVVISGVLEEAYDLLGLLEHHVDDDLPRYLEAYPELDVEMVGRGRGGREGIREVTWFTEHGAIAGTGKLEWLDGPEFLMSCDVEARGYAQPTQKADAFATTSCRVVPKVTEHVLYVRYVRRSRPSFT